MDGKSTLLALVASGGFASCVRPLSSATRFISTNISRVGSVIDGLLFGGLSKSGSVSVSWSVSALVTRGAAEPAETRISRVEPEVFTGTAAADDPAAAVGGQFMNVMMLASGRSDATMLAAEGTVVTSVLVVGLGSRLIVPGGRD